MNYCAEGTPEGFPRVQTNMPGRWGRGRGPGGSSGKSFIPWRCIRAERVYEEDRQKGERKRERGSKGAHPMGGKVEKERAGGGAFSRMGLASPLLWFMRQGFSV